MVELERLLPTPLRELGINEAELQRQVLGNPGLLGLGDLEVAAREHSQPAGGRIDFLMRDEEETYYAVEIMLGALDPSHIIRVIEYWDVERQRRPAHEHRAVIVAEDITARFFNVLRLLNRAVPLIAVKLSAFKIGDRIILHPVTVLDVLEEGVDLEFVDAAENVDRPHWEKKSPPLLECMDKIVAQIRTAGLDPRLTYNRGHIAMGTSGRNFCWFHPRKHMGSAHIVFRASGETRDELIERLHRDQIDASPKRTEQVAFKVAASGLDVHLPVITEVLVKAEEMSR